MERKQIDKIEEDQDETEYNDLEKKEDSSQNDSPSVTQVRKGLLKEIDLAKKRVKSASKKTKKIVSFLR